MPEEIKPGKTTSEFMQTCITQGMSFLAAVFGLLVATGVVGADFAAKWSGLVNQICGIALAAVGVLASWKTGESYNNGRVALKTDAALANSKKGMAAGQAG